MYFRSSLAVGLLVMSAAAHEAAADDYVVRVISDYDNLRMAFEPQQLAISPGESVTWVNEVAEEHDMVTYPNGYPQGANGFHSPRLSAAQENFTVKFDVPGTYEYHCTPHMILGMRGKIVVGAPSDPSEMNKPSRDEVLAYRTVLLEFFDDEELEELGVVNIDQ